MEPEEFFYHLWIPIILLLNSVKYIFFCDALSLLTVITIILFITIDSKKRNKLDLKKASPSLSSLRQEACTETSKPHVRNSATQTGEVLNLQASRQQANTEDKETQTAPSVYINVSTQTSNEKDEILRKESIQEHTQDENSQFGGLYRCAQQPDEIINLPILEEHANHGKKETRTPPIVFFNCSDEISKEKEVLDYTEKGRKEKESIQEQTQDENIHYDVLLHSFPSTHSIAEDPYFHLSELSVLPSSSKDSPFNKKKKKGWRKFKKSVKKIPHPHKIFKHK